MHPDSKPRSFGTWLIFYAPVATFEIIAVDCIARAAFDHGRQTIK